MLDPTNYNSLNGFMITTLNAKNKFGFIDGIAKEPNKTNSSYHFWKRYNNMVISLIVYLISDSIRQSVLWMDKVEEICNDMKSRYFQGNLSRIFYLQMEASSY